MPACYSRRVDEALAWVADAFRERRRKGTEIPYLSHLLAVGATVMEAGGDEDQVLAALLHDAIEDLDGIDEAFVAARFGPRVGRLVAALSDASRADKEEERRAPAAERARLWRARKEAYLAHLRRAPAEVRLVSTADKLHNARAIRRDHAAIGDALWNRFKGGRDGTFWYYRAVVDALSDGWTHPLLDELRAEVDALLAQAGAAR